MNEKVWPAGKSLAGKTVAIPGATGGIGVPVCRMLLRLSARLVLVCRNRDKAAELIVQLKTEFPEAHIFWVPVDLSDMESVKDAVKELNNLPVDILIHNAGAYAIPETVCATGFHPVYQINFVSPYYMTRKLLPHLQQRHAKVIVVGSIAHNYSHMDPRNCDFKGKKISKVYGNSKRYLMFAMAELMKQYPDVRFAIAHPGLAFTAMSNHFSKFTYALLKWPMKLIYMKPEKSARSIVMAIFKKVPYLHWIGPGHFHIWGDPKISKLTTCDVRERRAIYKTAEKIYTELEENNGK